MFLINAHLYSIVSVPRIIVRDLGRYGSKEELHKVYSNFGIIRNIWLATSPPGFAYVFFKDSREAMKAVSSTNGSIVCGERVRVEYLPTEDKKAFNNRISTKETSPSRGGGGGGRHHPQEHYVSSHRHRSPPPPPRHSSPSNYRGSRDYHTHQSSQVSRERYHTPSSRSSYSANAVHSRNESYHRDSPPPPPMHRDYGKRPMSQRSYNSTSQNDYRGGRMDSYAERGGRGEQYIDRSGRDRNDMYNNKSGRDRDDRYGNQYAGNRGKGRDEPPHDGYVVDRYKPQRERVSQTRTRYQTPPISRSKHENFSPSGGHYSHRRLPSYPRSPSPPPNHSRENDLQYRYQRSEKQRRGRQQQNYRKEERSYSQPQTHSKDNRQVPRPRQQNQSESRRVPTHERRSKYEQRPRGSQHRRRPSGRPQETITRRSRSPRSLSPPYGGGTSKLTMADASDYALYDGDTQYPISPRTPLSDKVKPSSSLSDDALMSKEDYSQDRESLSHSSPPEYVPEGESIQYTAADNETFNDQQYSSLPDEGNFEYSQEPEAFPLDAQFLQLEELKGDTTQQEEQVAEEPSAFYSEREITFSPPRMEREVIRVSNEREVRVSRSPSQRERLVLAL